MSKPHPKKKMHEALSRFPTFMMALEVVPGFKETYGKYMDEPLKVLDVRTFHAIGHLSLVRAIREQRPLTQFLHGLPNWCIASISCLDYVLAYPDLIDRVKRGEYDENQIRKMSGLEEIE